MYLFTSSERDIFKIFLAEHFGLDFEEHRHRILDRAVSRRMAAVAAASAEAYWRALSTSRAEQQRLVDAVTNNLSRFFRNAGQLRAIADLARRGLMCRGPDRHRSDGRSGRPDHDRSPCTGRLSIWIAGCATGEEPYSLAMTLRDVLGAGVDFDIMATDISEAALQIARRGEYPASVLPGIPAQALGRHMETTGTGVRVSDHIRESVSFRSHNLLDTPPLCNLDLVCCRNVITYFTPAARATAVSRCREALRCDGFLFIGNSESLPRRSGFVTVRTDTVRFYRRSCPRPR